jgi:hypothetical protein
MGFCALGLIGRKRIVPYDLARAERRKAISMPTVAGEVSLGLLGLAVLAVAYSILIIAYYMIQRREPYHELGGDTFYKRRPEVTTRHLIKRLQHFGFQVDSRLPTQTVI